jgi:hypothetical protein
VLPISLVTVPSLLLIYRMMLTRFKAQMGHHLKTDLIKIQKRLVSANTATLRGHQSILSVYRSRLDKEQRTSSHLVLVLHLQTTRTSIVNLLKPMLDL